MHQFTGQEDLSVFLSEQTPPCLSLYQRTHRHHPENQQDPIRFKNLLKTLEESLLLQYSKVEAEAQLDPFRALASDSNFWNHTWDGLVVLSAPDLFRVIKLQRPVPELAVAANSFHIRPLLRIQQSADRFQVLSVNRKEIRLFEGNRDALDEIDLAPGVPPNITEALGDELTEPHQTVTSHGGVGLGSDMRHGHGSKKDEVEIDEERFFRAIDRAILEHHSRPSGMPLMLAALSQYHTPFRRISHNPFLMLVGVEIDASSLTTDQLREKAWSLAEPEFRARLSGLADKFNEARSKGLGSDDLETVARAAADARVGSLLVEAERRIPGRIDKETGQVTFGGLDDPQVDDLLDDLAESVLSKGGHVVVAPALEMPTSTGIAGTFRF